MEKSTKKYWILALVIPFTMVGMFVAYMVMSYAKFAVTSSSGNSVSMQAPDMAKDSYYGGVYMDSTFLPTSNGGEDIIKTASISMSADDMDATMVSIQGLEEEYDAVTTTSQDAGKGADRYISITIKVEQSRFEEFYNKIKALPGEFTYSSTDATDVTETVQDLQARLDNLQSLEAQLADILKQAKTVTDILAVQKELSSTRTQIESLQTQIKNLDNQTSYSYVSMYMTQSSVGSQLSDNQWLPLGILKDAGRALVGFGKFMGTGLIYVLVFSPVIAAVVVPVIIIQKRAKK